MRGNWRKSLFVAHTRLNHSAYVEFNEFDSQIFVSCALIGTVPHFYVIGCGGGQFHCEPGGWVEGATFAVGTTPISIPERIVSVEYSKGPLSWIWNSRLTEILISNIRWNQGNVGRIITRANPVITMNFIGTSSKSPDVCSTPRLPVSHTQTLYVGCVNWTWCCCSKSICGSVLVSYGSATDVGVLLPIGGESDRVTSWRTTWLSKTQSLATLSSLVPCTRTVLSRVGNIEWCCKSPARTTTWKTGYNDISKDFTYVFTNLGSCHLSLLNGGTGFTVALQHCGRVGDRESGISLLLLGSSRLSCESEATESQQGNEHQDCHLLFENVPWVVVLFEFRQILSEMVFGSLL